ncbi:MAG TPA: hypothetical protein ENI23_07670 [bacterium]|nr:hypothetical protein [bacterium]
MITSTISPERKAKNARRAKAIRMKKNNATRLQTTTLDKLFVLACRAPELKSLYALRQSRESKRLTKPNYSIFIRTLDRLIEGL